MFPLNSTFGTYHVVTRDAVSPSDNRCQPYHVVENREAVVDALRVDLFHLIHDYEFFS